MKCQRGDFALRIQARLGLDDPGGTEIGPGEFLFARPAQRDGLARRLGEARGLHGAFAGMFAAESRRRNQG